MNFADLSHHQSDPINWSVYGATRDRVGLKATQGKNFIDSKFTERWRNSKAGVKYRLAYHYLEPDNPGAVDCGNFLSAVQSAGFTPNDWLVLDTEKLTTTDKVHPRARAASLEFVNTAMQRGFTKGIIYSYRYYLDTANLTAGDLPSGWRMLWLADYTVGQADSVIEVPPGWSRDQIIARQYTDKAGVAGLTGLVDDSRILKEWVKTTTSTPIPEDDPMSDPEVLKTLQHMDANIGTIITQGFRSTDADGNFNQQSQNNSVNGVNKQLIEVNQVLDEVKQLLNNLPAAIASALSPPT